MVVKVGVIGAGIMGVTSAYMLKAKYPLLHVDLISESFPPNTTTDVGAGYWRPPEQEQKHLQQYTTWCAKTLNYIQENMKNNRDAANMGISVCHGYYLARDSETEKPYWSDLVPNFHFLSKDELVRFPSYIKSGYAYSTGVTEGTKYTKYFLEKLIQMHVKILQQQVKCISELYQKYDVIINCAGVGARDLVPDQQVFPIKGHVLRVKAPWIKEFVVMTELDENDMAPCVFPSQECVVVGVIKRQNDTSKEPCIADRERMINKAKEFYPSLEYASILEEKVGSRPARHEIRMEMEMLKDENIKAKAVIHNYGHNSWGLSMYWGCGEEVLELFKEVFNKFKLFPTKANL